MRALTLSALLLALLLLGTLAPSLHAEDPEPLPEDPRVATVTAREGEAFVRPPDRRRWTLLAEDVPVFPGDTLRVGARGANILQVALRDGGRLTLGPGALVDLPEKGVVHLRRGEVELEAPADGTLDLVTPDGKTETVAKTTWWRAATDAARRLEDAPRWLEGWRESVGDQWVGSLIANVDGRDVPLAVGSYKTTVEIRDRIARTTIEQAFVNATDQRLEGVFYFPLPADASISGFGMWIGGELVEADVVERSRARQIYEDILRRKKDPGLLEWQGGNLFKARVFPIEPNAEKRIRIRYTQVLRLEGDTYRYRQALRSDLLRERPLRRLDIQVNVLSERPLRGVGCANRACDVTKSEHTARLEYTAEEFTPENDLEVQVTLAGSEPLTALTHRRGEDGYFLLALQPPEPEGRGWRRALLPEGEGLELVLLADTSGSMDARAREIQAAFVGGLLQQLGEDDRFQLLAGDRFVTELTAGPEPATPGNVEAALKALEDRASLGWSDLDRLFEAAKERAGEGAIVIYVGDGIPTTGDADPTAATNRLQRLGEGAAFTVHAVATSSTYEARVLEAMAAIGGGSVRRADEGALAAAEALLMEAARPSLKDLRVEIRGVETARVYPETLPNLPLGTQQFVLGLLRPSEEARQATVVVRGTLEGEPVVYEADLVVPADDGGNSFLPRLWARRHLDYLLAQGSSPEVQEQIVAFSRRYGIMTPYTSFLVLEDEEDRARYGVERTVHMRDGEAFFTEAKDRAALEAMREAVRASRLWREGLRRRMIQEIAGLGRDLIPSEPIRPVAWGWIDAPTEAPQLAFADAQGGGDKFADEISVTAGGGAGGAWGARHGGRAGGELGRLAEREFGAQADWDDAPVTQDAAMPAPSAAAQPMQRGAERAESASDDSADFAPPAPEDLLGETQDSEEVEELRSNRRHRAGRPAATPTSPAPPQRAKLGQQFALARKSLERQDAVGGLARPSRAPSAWTPGAVGWPALAAEPADATDAKPAPDWPPEVLGALERLEIARALARADVRFALEETVVPLHPQRGPQEEARRIRTLLAGPDGWYARATAPGASPAAAWLDAEHRAVVDEGRGLGRRRPSVEGDADRLPVSLALFAYDDLIERYRRHPARAEGTEDGGLLVVLEPRTLDGTTLHLRFDAEGALVEARSERWGRIEARRTFADHQVLGGVPVPTVEEAFDERGRAVERVTRTLETLDAETLRQRRSAAVARHAAVAWLGAVDPTLAEARAAREAGRATFADHLILALEAAGLSQDAEALQSWRQARETVEALPGLDLVEAQLLAHLRRGPELEALLRQITRGDWHGEDDAAAWLAQTLASLAGGSLGPSEQRQLSELEGFRARWMRTESRRALVAWNMWQRRLAEQEGRDDVLVPFPLTFFFLETLDRHVDDLARRGEVDAALVQIRTWLDMAGTWDREELGRLHRMRTDLLWRFRRIEALEAATRAWTESVPTEAEAWRRHASVLYLIGRADEADAWILDQLRAPVSEDPYDAATAKADAATALALGGGWWYSTGVEEPYRAPLADRAQRLVLAGPPASQRAGSILGHWRFQRTPEHDDAVRALRDALAQRLDTLPVETLHALVQRLPWQAGGDLGLEPEAFQALALALRLRWEREESLAALTSLGLAIVDIHDAHEDPEGAVAFLRLWHDRVEGEQRRSLAAGLVDRLFGLDWTGDREEEVVRLLGDLLPETDASRRDFVAAIAARRFAAWSFEGRQKKQMGPPPSWEGLSRAELRLRRREAADEARSQVIDVLATVRDALGAPYRRWLEIERLGYGVELGQDLEDVSAAAREALDGVPVASDAPLDRILAARAVRVLDYAATRRDAPEGLADGVAELLARRQKAPEDDRLDWRYERFRLLVALGRQDEVTRLLGGWVEEGPAYGAWREPLARLLAERGEMDAAARVLEASEGLGEEAYALLAKIHLARGDDEAREAALDRRLYAMSVNELSNALYAARQKLRPGRGEISGDLDPQTVREARVLLSKASEPTNWFWNVRAIYERTRDHRMLTAMAEAVPGHTTEAAYGLLAAIANLPTYEEATLDAAAERARALAEASEDAVDVRALKLLEAMLEARASKTPDPDVDHAARALAALEAARRAPVRPEERRPLASYLAAWGKVPLDDLAAAQLAWLDALVRESADGTPVGLAIARSHADTLAAYGREAEAVSVLAAALERVRGPEGRALPPWADDAFGVMILKQNALGHFAAAEKAIREEMARRDDAGRRDALMTNLMGVYHQALARGGSTARGHGEALLEAATAEMARFFEEGSPWLVPQVFQAFVGLFDGAAQGKAVPDPGRRLERFAREELKEALPRFLPEATSLVTTAAYGIERRAGPKAALGYALDRMDTEPAFFDRIGQDLWSNTHWTLANWRKNAGDIGELAPRLLARVLDALGTWLEGGERHGQAFYRQGDSRFWAEKRQDFLARAQAAAERAPASATLQHRVADYLRDDLREQKIAADLLLAAYERGAVHARALRDLSRWLVADRRWPQAREVTASLLDAWPESLESWRLSAKALAGGGLKAQGLERLREAETRWREREAFNWSVAEDLGEDALTIEAHEAAVTWLEEAASLRSAGRSGSDTRLSRIWQKLARARAALGRTGAAVDAAMAGVVAAGTRQGNLQEALQSLDAALAAASDLDAWVADWNERVEREGADAPVLRKALARVFEKRGDLEAAVAQLRIARELAPEDAEIHQRLVALHDRLDRPAEAIDALRISLRVAPRNLQAAADLASRLEKAGQEEQAERARTNLVEPLPNEAEGHRMLAKIRAEHGQLEAFAAQWGQVVRTEPLDPAVWIAHAEALIAIGEKERAKEQLRHVLEEDWEERFGDVKKQAARLLAGL